jgi:hypothetical protein
MGLLDWLTKREKPLAKMTPDELRHQELLLDKDRAQLLRRVETLAAEKQGLFDRGAREKLPEARRMMAQEFELKTTEQLMVGRQLNIRSKEALTIGRLRMLKENAARSKERGGLVPINECDLIALERLIEDDAVSTEMYQERLDRVLSLGTSVDQGATGLSQAGQQVMDIWDKMDSGLIKDSSEGFDEADRRVRERQAGSEPG